MKTEIDQSYRWRGMRFRLSLFTVSLVLFALGVGEAWHGGGPVNLWMALFVLSVVAGLTFEYRLKRSYHCPRCRALLNAPDVMVVAGDDEYVYRCTACDILWRTRTHPPDSAG